MTYDDDTLRRVLFIKRSQQLGFSLGDIEEMLALRGSRSEARCEKIRERAVRKLGDIEQTLATLRAMRDVLESLVTSCGSLEPGTCPLIEALDEGPESGTVVH